MAREYSKSTTFTRNLWWVVILLPIAVISFWLYVDAEKEIDRANDLRHTSFVLAEELHESSDELTRMVRTYVVTGNPLYKHFYQDILDIRDGRLPRPQGYSTTYWDLVTADPDIHSNTGSFSIPLLELMRRTGFTQSELARLIEAKNQSEQLTAIEFEAMRLAESTGKNAAANHARARLMLYDGQYHQAKARIMQPIHDSLQSLDVRTAKSVSAAEARATRYRLVFVLIGFALFWRMARTYGALHKELGGTVEQVRSDIARIGSGDLSQPIAVTPGNKNSVLGWLAQMQKNLLRLQSEREAANAKLQRNSRLYAALSQCNQAIVRCDSEAELFAQICRDAVKFGGMKMAWMGRVDETTGLIQAVASFGSGIEYLDDLVISTEASGPKGHGPTSTAMRENHPYWCQDFQHAPETSAWHERGARFGWGASAALPIAQKGVVVGAFTLYAGEVDAFDEDAKSLLVEMAMDISYALDRFADKAETRKTQQRLMESETLYRTAFVTSPDSININRLADGLYLDVNEGFTRISGWQRDEVVGRTSAEINIWHDMADRGRLVKAVQRDGYCNNLEAEFVMKDGRIITGLMSARLIQIEGVPCILNITRDITELKHKEAEIEQLAHFDHLTGLPNRHLLNERFGYALSLAQRSGESLAVMFLDLDHFKNINDTLGHSVGDQFLLEVAHRLKNLLRAEDTVSRLGGDEFILVFPGTDNDGAAQIVAKLIRAISEPFRIDANELAVTPSIGIAIYPDDGATFEELMKNADTAMYRVKQESRNGFRFFTAEMQSHSERNLTLANALRNALARNELQLHYQPQITLSDGHIIGAEVLLRWRHPELGMVSPAEFIPIAEDSGQIIAIGEWVLRTAVRQAKAWQDSGMPAIVFAVNLSAVQFRQPELVESITRILDEAQLAPEYLELELTEAVTMDDPQAAVEIMDKLHARGIRMSIDDFGTGYSSLNYLKRFKVYKLKIDQSFVRDLTDDPEDKAIVTTIINLASSLGLHTIAEGVETASQLAFLRLHGCNEVQGYYFSRPLPREEFEAFVRNQP